MNAFFSQRTLLLVPIACAAIYGCSHEEEEEPLSPELADVLFEGGATDEALVALDSAIDQKAPVDDPTRAPILDKPVGATLPKTPIPTFTWHVGGMTQVEHLGLRVAFGALRPKPRLSPHDLHAPTLLQLPETTPTFRSALGEFFGPVKAAHAHGDPLVGPAVFLVFSSAKDPKLARIFTNLTSYTPAQSVWDKLVAANAEITLSLVGAEFDANRIADGGGPFQGTKYTFTITP